MYIAADADAQLHEIQIAEQQGIRHEEMYLLQGSTLQEWLQALMQLAAQQGQPGLVRAAERMQHMHWGHTHWDHTQHMRWDHNHSMPHSLWGSILRQHMDRQLGIVLLAHWT